MRGRRGETGKGEGRRGVGTENKGMVSCGMRKHMHLKKREFHYE